MGVHDKRVVFVICTTPSHLLPTHIRWIPHETGGEPPASGSPNDIYLYSTLDHHHHRALYIFFTDPQSSSSSFLHALISIYSIESTLTPVGPKRYGSAVGFEAESAEGDRWLVKLGMDNARGKATSSILSQSLARMGIAADAIKELVATELYEVLPRHACRAPMPDPRLAMINHPLPSSGRSFHGGFLLSPRSGWRGHV